MRKIGFLCLMMCLPIQGHALSDVKEAQLAPLTNETKVEAITEDELAQMRLEIRRGLRELEGGELAQITRISGIPEETLFRIKESDLLEPGGLTYHSNFFQQLAGLISFENIIPLLDALEVVQDKTSSDVIASSRHMNTKKFLWEIIMPQQDGHLALLIDEEGSYLFTDPENETQVLLRYEPHRVKEEQIDVIISVDAIKIVRDPNGLNSVATHFEKTKIPLGTIVLNVARGDLGLRISVKEFVETRTQNDFSFRVQDQGRMAHKDKLKLLALVYGVSSDDRTTFSWQQAVRKDIEGALDELGILAPTFAQSSLSLLRSAITSQIEPTQVRNEVDAYVDSLQWEAESSRLLGFHSTNVEEIYKAENFFYQKDHKERRSVGEFLDSEDVFERFKALTQFIREEVSQTAQMDYWNDLIIHFNLPQNAESSMIIHRYGILVELIEKILGQRQAYAVFDQALKQYQTHLAGVVLREKMLAEARARFHTIQWPVTEDVEVELLVTKNDDDLRTDDYMRFQVQLTKVMVKGVAVDIVHLNRLRFGEIALKVFGAKDKKYLYVETIQSSSQTPEFLGYVKKILKKAERESGNKFHMKSLERVLKSFMLPNPQSRFFSKDNTWRNAVLPYFEEAFLKAGGDFIFLDTPKNHVFLEVMERKYMHDREYVDGKERVLDLTNSLKVNYSQPNKGYRERGLNERELPIEIFTQMYFSHSYRNERYRLIRGDAFDFNALAQYSFWVKNLRDVYGEEQASNDILRAA